MKLIVMKLKATKMKVLNESFASSLTCALETLSLTCAYSLVLFAGIQLFNNVI